MTKAALVLCLLALPLATALQPADRAGGAVVTTAHVSGFDLDSPSPGLQEEDLSLIAASICRWIPARLTALIDHIVAAYSDKKWDLIACGRHA